MRPDQNCLFAKVRNNTHIKYKIMKLLSVADFKRFRDSPNSFVLIDTVRDLAIDRRLTEKTLFRRINSSRSKSLEEKKPATNRFGAMPLSLWYI